LYYKKYICSTIKAMVMSVQARLDEESAAALELLVRRNGWSTSRAVREGLHLLAKQQMPRKPLKIIGQGEFSSGIPDLATNKKYLAGFGLNSGVDPIPRVKRKSR
jgi:hypothetical protein